MFQGLQRLKAGIDSRIAEEQARQRSLASGTASTSASTTNSTSASPTRSNSTRRVPTSNPGNESPIRKPRRPRLREDEGSGSTRSIDPADFEAAFSLEDDSAPPSRVGTPVTGGEKSAAMERSVGAGDGDSDTGPNDGADESRTVDLPAHLRTKLRRAEKMEAQYSELMSNYRLAHSQASAIGPFEKALKENTPLVTIKDPDALLEYLNQSNLKTDMVIAELKRVTADRDAYKRNFEEAETKLARLSTQTGSDTVHLDLNLEPKSATSGSASSAIKSPVTAVSTATPASIIGETPASTNHDLFSYDEEVPRLQESLKAKAQEVTELRQRVTALEKDLVSANASSTGSMADLEKVTRELEELKSTIDNNNRAIKDEYLAGKFDSASKKLAALETQLLEQQTDAQQKLVASERARSDVVDKLQAGNMHLLKQKVELLREYNMLKQAHEKVDKTKVQMEAELQEIKASKANDEKRIGELTAELENNTSMSTATTAAPSQNGDSTSAAQTSTKKKNNKKKKKGVASSTTNVLAVTNGSGEASSGSAVLGIEELKAEIAELKTNISARDAEIAKLQSKRRTEDELREEVENMQENLLVVGQEHVEAKEIIKELTAEKTALQTRVSELENELHFSITQAAGSDQAAENMTSLTQEYDDLKMKTVTLQTDLAAAQQLAASRYRDLTDLKDVLTKAQPELKTLRAENATLKATKEELTTKTSELRRLENREKDLKNDIASFKSQASDSTNEIRQLSEKAVQESAARVKAEDLARYAARDARKAEADKVVLSAAVEKANAELQKVTAEATKLRKRVPELQAKVDGLEAARAQLQVEVQEHGRQAETSQSLLGSVRDQSSEMAMQLREAQARAAEVEEELVEVQRLLGERGREAETMRRLLADVDGRADSRVNEMKERMERAEAERDRVEDEAGREARRRTREGDELKGRVRELEKEKQQMQAEHQTVEQSEKHALERTTAMEAESTRKDAEAEELRTAMSNMRTALDGSENMAREAERAHTDLYGVLDEANTRYEKLRREFQALQAQLRPQHGNTSARASMETIRIASPTPSSLNANAAKPAIDQAYLKTILLQFLEQKDKRIKTSLVETVLGELLALDSKDRVRWIAAIASM